MKVLLVNPRQTASLFSFSDVEDITGCRAYMPNLALPTLAALTPEDVQVTLADENVEPIEPLLETHWDLVGITGYITQAPRMFAVADECRRRGLTVAIGGPYATLSSGTVRPHADVLFAGEAEGTWPQFLDDWRHGSWSSEYRAPEPVPLDQSPPPKIGMLKCRDYLMGVVQTSRGCPFECEFCDVIVYLGRRQRHKAVSQLVVELDEMYRVGYRHVFLSDDNLTAHPGKAAAIMTAIGEWNARRRERMSFATQLSIEVAKHTELLALCARAGLTQAFVGIESPDHSALREVKKRQNVRKDLASDVHAIQRAGIMVQGGMISGFDSDTMDSFRRQYDFVQEAGIPMVSVTMLNAPEGTPLERRLLKEGRLLMTPMHDMYLTTNIVPKRMSGDELRRGTQWLLNKLYAPEAFLERIAVLAGHVPTTEDARLTSPRSVYIWQNIVRAYERLGAEFRDVPREAVRLFRGRDTAALGNALIFLKSVVSVLRTWGLWDPAMARSSEPAA